MRTGDNDRFLRQWHEVSFDNLNPKSANAFQAAESGKKWFPFVKGGDFRKWFGNVDQVVNWEEDGYEIKESTLAKYPQLSWDNLGWKISNENFYFRPAITWSAVSSSCFGVRFVDEGNIFGTGGSCIFPEESKFERLGALLCSKLGHYFIGIVNPTLNINIEDVAAIPVVGKLPESSAKIAQSCYEISRVDWDSYESSLNFSCLPLLNSNCLQETVKATYHQVRNIWQQKVSEMQRHEEENNRIFIDAYGLQDELTSDVPLNEITLTCNPYYRYGNDKTEDELEALLLADTTRELISYAVGCMLGRYSLDKPGLILANQGDTLQQFLEQVPNPSFSPDEDNVIPMLEDDWFADDIAERFRAFMRVAFGDKNLDENIAFIESAIGKDLRKYFLKDFYADHVKRYKKRPIYWMFSSPKGSFNALIYMHRYRPDTVSIVLNDYLREFRTKLTAKKENLEQVTISASASQREKTQALKEIEKIDKTLDEINEYEHEVLYPLATQQIEIDLDDGVKVNYPKFGKALKKIPGLEGKGS